MNLYLSQCKCDAICGIYRVKDDGLSYEPSRIESPLSANKKLIETIQLDMREENLNADL